MKNKIQTGLRLPEPLYDRLLEISEAYGISINSTVLFLVGTGLEAIDRGILESHHAGIHIRKDTDE